MKEFICLYSIDAIDLNDKVKTYYGFLFANDFTDAVEQLEKSLYGTDLMQINEIKLFDAVPQCSKEIYSQLKQELAAI